MKQGPVTKFYVNLRGSMDANSNCWDRGNWLIGKPGQPGFMTYYNVIVTDYYIVKKTTYKSTVVDDVNNLPQGITATGTSGYHPFIGNWYTEDTNMVQF